MISAIIYNKFPNESTQKALLSLFTMLFTSALLSRLTHYFALDFGQSDTNWLSNPAKRNSDAKLVRNSSDTDWFMGEFPLAMLFKYFSDTPILEKIKSKGYNIEFELDTVDPFVHKITLADRSQGSTEVIFQGKAIKRNLYSQTGHFPL